MTHRSKHLGACVRHYTGRGVPWSLGKSWRNRICLFGHTSTPLRLKIDGNRESIDLYVYVCMIVIVIYTAVNYHSNGKWTRIADVFPFEHGIMGIFYFYVSLPEGSKSIKHKFFNILCPDTARVVYIQCVFFLLRSLGWWKKGTWKWICWKFLRSLGCILSDLLKNQATSKWISVTWIETP